MGRFQFRDFDVVCRTNRDARLSPAPGGEDYSCREMLRRLVRVATPATVHEARAAADYRRSHLLSSGGVQLLRAYRDAARYGLHLLPPGLRLDGLVVDIGANIGGSPWW